MEREDRVVDKFSRTLSIIALITSLVATIFPIYQDIRDNKENIKIDIEDLCSFHIKVRETFLDNYLDGKYDETNIDDGFVVYIGETVTLYNLSKNPCITKEDTFIYKDVPLEVRNEKKSEFVNERLEAYSSAVHFVSVPLQLNNRQKQIIYEEIQSAFGTHTVEEMRLSITGNYLGRDYYLPLYISSAIEDGLRKYYQETDDVIEYEYVLETAKERYTKSRVINPKEFEQ